MIKYKTKSYSARIFEVEVQKETDLSVWVNGHRESKDTRYSKYSDTFDDAKNYLVKRIESKIESLSRQLKNEKERLEEARSLKEETNA